MTSHTPAAKKAAVAHKGGDGFTGRALHLADAPLREEARQYRSDANVIAAATMREVDQPRFQQIHNLFKNKNTELVTEVLSLFKRQKTKEEARQWMAENVGTPPGTKLTRAELVEIALVSLALTKYGASRLNEWYDTKRLDQYVDFPLRSDELRSGDQKKYRDQSRSTQKDGKDTAHYVGLDFVVKLNRDLPEQHRVASKPLKALLNDFENFRLVKLETNRGLHKEVDALLLRAYNGEVVRLTAVQRERVAHIVRFCQSEIFQTSMIQSRGVYLYAKIRGVVKLLEPESVPESQRLWQDQRDRPGLQADAAKARLKTDGTPDLRFKENKTLSDLELNAAALARTPSRAVDEEEVRRRTSAPRSTSTRASPPPPPTTPTTARPNGPSQGKTPSNGQSRPKSTAPSRALPKTTQSSVPGPGEKTNDRQLFVGPKGGRYYISDSGRKVYVQDGK